MTPDVQAGFDFREFVVDDFAEKELTSAQKIDIHIAMGEPERAMVRVIMFFVPGRAGHRPIAGRAQVFRADDRIIVRAVGVLVMILSEKFAVDFDSE